MAMRLQCHVSVSHSYVDVTIPYRPIRLICRPQFNHSACIVHVFIYYSFDVRFQGSWEKSKITFCRHRESMLQFSIAIRCSYIHPFNHAKICFGLRYVYALNERT